MKDKQKIFLKAAWLVLGLAFQYLAGGDRPIGPAVWLAPLFLLRFFRETGAWRAFALALPAMTAVQILACRGMLPLPSLKSTLTVFGSMAAWALLPYLLDRLAYRHLPSSMRIFLFPSLVVSLPLLWSPQGTWFHPVNALDDLALLQLASLAGLSGISFLIHGTAAAVNEIWEQRKSPIIARKLTASVLGALLLVYGFGFLRLRSAPTAEKTIRAAAVVPDPSIREKLMNSFPALLRSDPRNPEATDSLRRDWTTVFNDLLAKSVALSKSGFDLAVWPEGSAVLFEDEERILVEQASAAARENKIRLGLSVMVFQNLSRPRKPGPQPAFKNKLILISPDGEIEWEHEKSFLAPGLEAAVTIPGDRLLKVRDSGPTRITGAICYEMDFPGYIRQAAAIGADLLLAPSNDWDAIKNMHARMARLRAIENGLAVFRPAMGGISTAVDPYGRLIARADFSRNVGAPMTAVLPLDRVPTLYSTWGEYFKWFCTFLSAIGGAAAIYWGILNGIRKRKSNASNANKERI